MTVELNDERDAYVVKYAKAKVNGATASLRATNPNDISDVSTHENFVNDGNTYVSFPAGYHGESNLEIEGSEGGVDTGTIAV